MTAGGGMAADALGALPFALLVFDAHGTLTFANATAAAAIGLPPDATGLTIAEAAGLAARRGLFGPGDPDVLARDCLAADRTRPFQCLLRRADGSRHELRGIPLPGGGFCAVDLDVTTYYETTSAAARRSRLLETLVGRLHGGLLLFDAGLRLVTGNSGAEALLGLPRGLLVPGIEHAALLALLAGRPCFEPADLERLRRLDRDRPLEHAVRRRNGRVLRIVNQPMPEGGFLLEIDDITALARAEDEARHRAGLLDAVLEALPVGVVVVGPDGRIGMVNAAYGAIMGGAPVALGEAWAEVVRRRAAAGEYGVGDPSALARAELEATAGEGPRRPRLRRRPDGTILGLSRAPLPDGGFVKVAADITALQAAEARATERAAVLQTMLDTMRHGIALYGVDRRLVAANRLACELTGLTPEEMVPGRSMDVLLDLQAARGWLDAGAAALLRAADRRRPSSGTRPLPDGRIVEAASSPTPDGGFVVTWTDVTSRARAEQAAEERAALLRTTLDNVRHGLALYGPGPDHRLLAASALAGPAFGLPALAERIGVRFVDLVEEQRAAGALGPGPAGRETADRFLALDRRLSHRQLRPRQDGGMLEVVSHPTPEGGFTISHTDVTDLMRAQEAAAERAATLQVMLDHMRHAITYFGPDGRVIAANRLAEVMNDAPPGRSPVGMTLEDLIAAQVESGTMGEEAARIARMALELDRTRPHRYVRPASRGRVIEVTSDPTPDGGFVVTHADVTALASAQQEAAARAATLQVMLDHMRHGITYFGPDRRVIASNRLDHAFSGLPGDFVRIGRLVDELAAEQVRRGVGGPEAASFAAMALGLDRSKPHRYVRPAGDGRVIEVTSDPTPDGGFVITRADITALATAEAEAKRRGDVQQMMLDNIRHGICLVDAEGRIVAANPVFRQLFDLPEAVARPGEPYFAFIDWLADRGEYGEGAERQAAVAAIRDVDRRQAFLKVRTRRDGSVIEVASDPTPDGGFVLTFSDVTADRRIRAELERAKEAAEEASRAKSRFLAAVSHELRTPLNAVIGFSEALAAGAPAAATGEYGRAILEAGRHLLTLIDDILEAARAEGLGAEVAAAGEADIRALVEAAVEAAAPAAEAGGLHLAAPRLPRGGLPRLRADERRLRLVLRALLSNAVKFTAPGGRVTVSVDRELGTAGAGGLVVRVADTGIGMRPEDIPRVFEPFTQVDGGIARRFPGAGLGLYLARAMAEAQGATLDLESAPGRGTTAVLRFPASRLLAQPRTRRVGAGR